MSASDIQPLITLFAFVLTAGGFVVSSVWAIAKINTAIGIQQEKLSNLQRRVEDLEERVNNI